MKGLIRPIFYVAMLLLTVTACSDNDVTTGDNTEVMTFTALLNAPGSDATTRTTFTPGFSGANKGKLLLSWESEENITLLTTNAAQTVIGRTFDFSGTSSNGTTCQFSGITIKKTDDEKYSFFYPPVTPTYTDDTNLAGGDFTIDYSQQTQLGNSTTAHLKDFYPIYWADPENTPQGTPYAAVFHIGIDLPNKGTLTKVVLRKKAGASGALANNFRFSTKTNSTTGSITLNVVSGMANLRWDVYMVVAPGRADGLEMDLYTKEMGDQAPLGTYELTTTRPGGSVSFEAGKVYHYNSTEMMPDPSYIQWADMGLYEKQDENGRWVITTPEDATHKAYIADRNIGALYLYDTGYLFSWGDVTPKTVALLGNYSLYANGQYLDVPDCICGNINYDPATYYIGPDCRMLTLAEAEWLSDTGNNPNITFPEEVYASTDYIKYYDYDSQEHYYEYKYKPLIVTATGEEFRFYMNGMAGSSGYHSYDASYTWIGELFKEDIGYNVFTRSYLFQVNSSLAGNDPDHLWHTGLGPMNREIAAPVRSVKMVPIE